MMVPFYYYILHSIRFSLTIKTSDLLIWDYGSCIKTRTCDLIDVNDVLSPTGRIVQLFDEGVQPPKASPLRDFSWYFYSAQRVQIPA